MLDDVLTGILRTVSASATSERWHRQGTASAHISAEGFVFGELDGAFERGFKFRRLHVVRESAETPSCANPD